MSDVMRICQSLFDVCMYVCVYSDVVDSIATRHGRSGATAARHCQTHCQSDGRVQIAYVYTCRTLRCSCLLLMCMYVCSGGRESVRRTV